ncbi:MAG: hypothetical protein E6J90_33005 [Deltaproteobacteria bacterium]|nr:MAG: hypothetical protein E6J90_33005 [Deltaproteobacteria bacterium]TMQ19681.1 MAG: hypothetical protein E6J91_05705 [Deltaproteobacteria bacterium]
MSQRDGRDSDVAGTAASSAPREQHAPGKRPIVEQSPGQRPDRAPGLGPTTYDVQGIGPTTSEHAGGAVSTTRAAPLAAGQGGPGAHSIAPPAASAAAPLAWRNAVIDGENRIQAVVRAAQHDKKGRIQLELIIEPDFVEIDQHTATGAAPAGKDPDGIGVHNAAIAALRDIAEQPPKSRRVVTVVLDRTPDGWERSRFALTGETKPASEARATTVTAGQSEIANILQLALAGHHSEVTMDVACSPDGVRVLSWRSSGTAAGSTAQPSTERVTRAFAELAGLAGGRTLVYELRQRFASDGWQPEAMKLLGEVKAPEADANEGHEQADEHVQDPNDAEEIVADVKNKRRLVLSAAAEMIAEQDPTRLHNLLFSLGPLLLVGMVKVGKVVRLGKRWRPRLITDDVCRVGCEGIARQINRHIGGPSFELSPRVGRLWEVSVATRGIGRTMKS